MGISYKTEYGRCKRLLTIAEDKVKSLEMQVEAEKAKCAAYMQMQDLDRALITAVVRTLGEVKVSQALINEMLEKRVHTIVHYGHDTGEHILRTTPEDTEGAE